MIYQGSQESIPKQAERFYNIYNLFTPYQVEQLLERGSVTIDVDYSRLSAHEQTRLEQGNIYTHQFDKGKLVEIKLIKLFEADNQKSKATFELIK